MKPYNTIDEDLLVKYLANETNDGETLMVENWIQASDENKKQFEQFLFIWEQSLQLTAPTTVNVDDAWLRMQQRIKKEGNGTTVMPVKSLSKSWLRIAAAVVLFVCVGWLGYLLVSINRA